MKKIAIRSDGDASIGMGHIMRCLSLAKTMQKLNCQVIFISKCLPGIERISKEGFEAIRIEATLLSLEADEIKRVIHSRGIDVLIVDSYNVSCEYLSSIKPLNGKIAYIDDINSFKYPVDILINGNITGKYLGYRRFKPDEKLLCGPEYNLIRDEFAGLPRRHPVERVKELMITTGGADPYDLSIRLTEIILSDSLLNELKINVILGSLYKNKEQLQQIQRDYPNVLLYENHTRISEIMFKSDIAISSGGSTLYELCACGTPALAFVMADNQELIVKKLSELGYIQSLGWYNKMDANGILDKIHSLCSDFEKRKHLSGKMQTLVDGNGSLRVAEAVLETIKAE